MTIYDTVPEDVEGFDPDYVVPDVAPEDISKELTDIPDGLSEDK